MYSHDECVENQTMSEVAIHFKVHQSKQDSGTSNCRSTCHWYGGNSHTKIKGVIISPINSRHDVAKENWFRN